MHLSEKVKDEIQGVGDSGKWRGSSECGIVYGNAISQRLITDEQEAILPLYLEECFVDTNRDRSTSLALVKVADFA
jgi:hypothetical protein